jgi:calcium-dependent protein kinase
MLTFYLFSCLQIYRNEVKRNILTKELSFEGDVWKAISDDAKGFVTSLLQRSPENRPKAREALQHQFILKYQRSTLSSRLDPELVTKIHTSMKCFAESSHFKKTILQWIATRYPSDEVLHLTHIFTKLDKSGEGVIYFSDFKEFLSDFHYIDSDLKNLFRCIVSSNIVNVNCFLFMNTNILLLSFLLCRK